MQCGHCYCKSCLCELKRHSLNKRNINCPMCRENTALGEISYVNTMSEALQENLEEKMIEPPPPFPENVLELEKLAENVEIKKLRKHSAKAELIVQKLKEILRAHPEDKVLIFSAVRTVFHNLAVSNFQLICSGQICWIYCIEHLPKMAFYVLRQSRARNSRRQFNYLRQVYLTLYYEMLHNILFSSDSLFIQHVTQC